MAPLGQVAALHNVHEVRFRLHDISMHRYCICRLALHGAWAADIMMISCDEAHPME